MDITDYIPNVFGYAAPTSYDSLQTMGLISPQQAAQQQKTANIQGLLGAGLALAQGMSAVGPRRSAAENILGALAGGFGAAGGAYQQGIQNVVQQQQLQSAALQQQQSVNRLNAIKQASKDNPQLAQLFAINPEEATKQLLAMERAKMYGFSTEGQATQMPAEVPAAMPTQVVPQAPMPTDGAQAQPQVTTMVDPANVAKANDLRKKAALAISLGDKDTAKFLQDEAERFDPKEQLFFRDDKLVSSKRGIIGDFSGGKILTNEQATALGLDPNRGKWTIKGGIPSLVTGTSSVRDLTKEEVINRNLDPNKQWQITPEGEVKAIQGSDFTSETSKKELISSLPKQFTNVYPTLKTSVDALIARAPTMTRDQIVQETEKILTADADIRKELDPTLQSADIKKRQAGAAKVNVSVAEKKFGEEFGRGVAGAVETTYNRATSAQQTISTINNIRPLIKEGVYSGPLSTSNMYIDRLASSLGITSGTINDKLVRTSQAMQGLASLELSAAEAMKGQGAITENERSLIARAAGGNFAQFTAAEVSGLLNALEKTAKSKISAHTKNLERLRKRKDTADLADFYELQSTDNLQDAARQELERRRGK
jgi:hypothetical protein